MKRKNTSTSSNLVLSSKARVAHRYSVANRVYVPQRPSQSPKRLSLRTALQKAAIWAMV